MSNRFRDQMALMAEDNDGLKILNDGLNVKARKLRLRISSEKKETNERRSREIKTNMRTNPRPSI